MERTYTIPLRKYWLRTSKYKRAKKAVNAVKEFISKHCKTENVKIGKELNKALWKQGIKRPPPKIRVNVKTTPEAALVELFGVAFEEVKKEEPKKTLTEKLGLTGQTKKEEKKPEAAKKEEIKTEKKPAEAKTETVTTEQKEKKPTQKPAEAKTETKKEDKQPTEKKETQPEKKTETKKPIKTETKEPAQSRKEKTVSQSTTEMFESAKKLNELAKKAEKKK